MASRTNDSKTASDVLKDEAEERPTSPHLSLLRPVAKVRNSDRLRFMGQMNKLSPVLDKMTETSADQLDSDAIEALADFTDYVSRVFAVDAEADETVQTLPFEEFMELIFAYLDALGESMGSSN